MTSEYEPDPTGRVGLAIAAMRADPDPRRIWSSSQLAQAAGCDITALCASMKVARERGVVHYRSEGWGRSEWRLIPFDAAPAAMKGETTATGWRPPAMVAARPGSDERLPKTAPAATCTESQTGPVEVPVFLPSIEKAKPEVKLEVAPSDVTAKTDMEPGPVFVAEDPDPDDEPQEPDAWISARTGAMVLTGVTLDEDGAITLLPELVRAIVRLAGREAP